MRSPSAATMERARRLNRANLPDLCIAITRGSLTDDGEGGFVAGAPVLTPFACRVQASGPMPAETQTGDQTIDPSRAVLCYDTDFELPLSARAEVRRANGSTELYEVISRQVDPSYAVMRRVDVRLVSPPVPEVES